MALLEGKGIWIVLLLVILLFGAKRLPDLSRSLGRSLRILKSETEGLRSDSDTSETTKVAAPPVAIAPVVPAGPRELIDPVTGEKVYAQPVSQPSAPAADKLPPA